MNSEIKSDYMVLHTDLDAIEKALVRAQHALSEAAQVVCRMYEEDRLLIENGQVLKPHLELDVMARAVLSTGLNLVALQLQSLLVSAEVTRQACEIEFPELANTTAIQ